MKFVFAVLLLAGLAFAEPESTPEAEADPAADAWDGYYGRGYGYGGYRGYGGSYGYPGYGYYRGKRDAEAKPAVLASSSALTAPQVVHPYGYAAGYGYGLPYAGHHAIPHAYTVSAPAVTHTVPAVTYTHPAAHVYHAGVYGFPHAYGGLYGYGLPVVAPAKEAERKKRNAESDPEATPRLTPRLRLPLMLGTDTTDAPAIMAMDTDTAAVDGEVIEVTMEAGEAMVFTDTETDGANRQKLITS